MRFRLSCLVISLLLVLFLANASLAAPPFPKEYPETFAQHKSCEMVQVLNFPNNISAMLDCGKTPMEAVHEYYLNRAKDDGWQVLMDTQTGDGAMCMAQKGEQAMQITVVVEDGKTQLGLSLIQHGN